VARPTSTTATIAEPESGSGLPRRHAIDSWRLSRRVANRSPATIRTYVDAAKRLKRFLRQSGMPVALAAIRREQIEAFLVSLQDAGSRPATVSLAYRCVRG